MTPCDFFKVTLLSSSRNKYWHPFGAGLKLDMSTCTSLLMLPYGFRGTTVGAFIERNVHIFAFGWSEGPKMADEFKVFTDYILVLFQAHLRDSPGVLLCIPNCAKWVKWQLEMCLFLLWFHDIRGRNDVKMQYFEPRSNKLLWGYHVFKKFQVPSWIMTFRSSFQQRTCGFLGTTVGGVFIENRGIFEGGWGRRLRWVLMIF